LGKHTILLIWNRHHAGSPFEGQKMENTEEIKPTRGGGKCARELPTGLLLKGATRTHRSEKKGESEKQMKIKKKRMGRKRKGQVIGFGKKLSRDAWERSEEERLSCSPTAGGDQRAVREGDAKGGSWWRKWDRQKKGREGYGSADSDRTRSSTVRQKSGGRRESSPKGKNALRREKYANSAFLRGTSPCAGRVRDEGQEKEVR